MNRTYRHLFAILRRLILATMLILPLATLYSCSSDEPDMLVGYYMTINSQVRLSLYEEDESQGTTASPVADVLSTTLVKMRTALQNAYPQNNTRGNDSRVIAACDAIYRQYKTMYGGEELNTVCVVKLYRASMDGEVVKHSKTLKTYHFGARPVKQE